MAELNRSTSENTGEDLDSDHESNDTAGHENSRLEGISKTLPLVLEQVRVVDKDGNLKVLYPSKTDFSMVSSLMTVIH